MPRSRISFLSRHFGSKAVYQSGRQKFVVGIVCCSEFNAYIESIRVSEIVGGVLNFLLQNVIIIIRIDISVFGVSSILSYRTVLYRTVR